MGLCKCPKRKVTNLFCFEHRVNVCESCLLSNHESCVVQTYISWLTDSDYDANCLLCFEPLNCKETVRLKCLHLYHWHCFDARARQLPDNTAPAGYKCPSCLECIFPAENQQSPVVDKLRARLQTVNWGRLGLGLPSLPDHELQRNAHHISNNHHNSSVVDNIIQQQYHQHQAVNSSSNNNAGTQQIASHEDPFEVNTFTARSKLLADHPGNGSLSSSVYIGDNSAEDDSKYTKKATAEQSIRGRFTRLPRSLKRLLMALGLLLLLYVLVHTLFGGPQPNQEEDPLFDPHANPNVRVQREVGGAAGRGES